jgi:alpha-tubulin suppressor-like RCC1 family protein
MALNTHTPKPSALALMTHTPTSAVLVPAGKARMPDDVTCVQVVAGDGFTFALSDQGCIYGWGQFKDDLSSFYSFGPGVKVQRLPALVYQPEVRQGDKPLSFAAVVALGGL